MHIQILVRKLLTYTKHQYFFKEIDPFSQKYMVNIYVLS